MEENTHPKRPKDGDFIQQRLPAWQPVMTPRTVLPALFLIGILFCPTGGLLWWNSNKVDEIMINYSQCKQYEQPVYMLPNKYKYTMSNKMDMAAIEPPAYSYSNVTSFLDPQWENPNQLTIPRCTIDFTVPHTMTQPLYLYYRLTNFYQNHRQYIKNFDSKQLLGNIVGGSALRTSCDPLAFSATGKVIYPCGLIANSMFNDTASNLTSVNTPSPLTYEFTTHGIAWPTDSKKYNPTKYAITDIVPPPNWAKRYPNGEYTAEYPPPELAMMERFQVWMHVAALSDFRKIWGKNEHDTLVAGRWRITIDMNFDTVQYKGTKWLVLSTVTSLGGYNPYLGIAYMAVGGICILIAIILTLIHLMKPRKLGDSSYLSWNQPGGGLPDNRQAKERLEKQE
ncbi:cell cycle control protein [Pilobolus umbonatus]|nr:cell cycle control protein [Pilobolus umbonatus]